MTRTHNVLSHCRQMRGEDLQGLTLEELVHLERTIDIGLARVIERKVHMIFIYITSLLYIVVIFPFALSLSVVNMTIFFSLFNNAHLHALSKYSLITIRFQGQQIMEELNSLQQKVAVANIIFS